MPGLICSQCGAENPSETEHCLKCGTPLFDHLHNKEEQPTGLPEDALDFLTQADDDLPSLLHALKHDEDLSSAEELEKADSHSDETSENEGAENPAEQKDELPEWLIRIRNRAQEEEDSVGEVTQKIFIAKEHLKADKRQSHHEDFSAWIEGLRGVPGEKELPPDRDSGQLSAAGAEEAAEEEEDWLTKIRIMEGKLPSEENQENKDTEGNSLLQWLVALEDGTEQPEPPSDETLSVDGESKDEVPQSVEQIELDELETTREIHLAGGVLVAPEASLVDVTRLEQQQADQLTALIVDEASPRPVVASIKTDSGWLLRLIVALVLIAGVSYSLYFKTPSPAPTASLQPQHADLISWTKQLPADASLLLVFDYQAAFAAEMLLIAKPVIADLFQDGRDISLLFTSVNGELLGRRLINEISDSNTLPLNDLGYYPSTALIAYSAGISDPPFWHLPSSPISGPRFSVSEFDGILIISDTFEGAHVWIDQISALMPETPINLVLSAQAGPLLMPYYESGQVTGMVSGVMEARQIASVRGESVEISVRWRAYQTGILLMVTVIVIGVIFSARPTGAQAGHVEGG